MEPTRPTSGKPGSTTKVTNASPIPPQFSGFVRILDKLDQHSKQAYDAASCGDDWTVNEQLENATQILQKNEALFSRAAENSALLQRTFQSLIKALLSFPFLESDADVNFYVNKILRDKLHLPQKNKETFVQSLRSETQNLAKLMDQVSTNRLRIGLPIVVKPFANLQKLYDFQTRFHQHELSFSSIGGVIILTVEGSDTSTARIADIVDYNGHTHIFENPLTPSENDTELCSLDNSQAYILSFNSETSAQMAYLKQKGQRPNFEDTAVWEHITSDKPRELIAKLKEFGLLA